MIQIEFQSMILKIEMFKKNSNEIECIRLSAVQWLSGMSESC